MILVLLNLSRSFNFWRKCLILRIWSVIIRISKKEIMKLWIPWINWPIWLLLILSVLMPIRKSLERDVTKYSPKSMKTGQVRLLYGTISCSNTKYWRCMGRVWLIWWLQTKRYRFKLFSSSSQRAYQRSTFNCWKSKASSCSKETSWNRTTKEATFHRQVFWWSMPPTDGRSLMDDRLIVFDSDILSRIKIRL